MIYNYDELIEGFLDKTLPKEKWTHEAHLIVGLWHAINFEPNVALELLSERIKSYNLTTGGINSDTGGYHETITAFYVWLLNEYQLRNKKDNASEVFEQFLKSKFKEQTIIFNFYSKDLLMSVAARRDFVEPDLQVFDFDFLTSS